MFHGSLTLLMRSVRDDALRQSGHALRLIAVVVLLFMLIVSQSQSLTESAPGLAFFENVAWLGSILITLAAIGHFCSSLTEEKEQGTLGLLLLANMTPLSILFGKSTNRIFSAWLLLMALLPFSLLSLTLGGITTLQIAATFVSLSAYLFLMANLALLVSALVRGTNVAISLMLVLTLALFALPEELKLVNDHMLDDHFVAAGGAWDRGIKTLYAVHQQFSVFHELVRIFDIEQTPVLISPQVIGSLIGGGICFLLAWWRFSFVVWAPDDSEAGIIRNVSQTNRWIKLVPRPWRVPLAWKDFYFISGGLVMLIARLLVYPVFIGLAFHFKDESQRLLQVTPVQLLQCLFLFLFVVEQFVTSTLLFQTERRNGTLSTIAMLPQSLVLTTLQKLAGCLLGSLPTLLILLWLFGYFPQEFWTGLTNSPPPVLAALLMWTIGACILLLVCQLTIFCSLYVNWGALPLAIGIMMTILIVFAPVLSGIGYMLQSQHQPFYTNFGPLLYLTGMFSLALQFETTRRLRRLAGE